MNRNLYSLFCVAMMVLALCSCSDRGNGKVTAADVNYGEIPDASQVIRVNNDGITKGEVAAEGRIREAIRGAKKGENAAEIVFRRYPSEVLLQQEAFRRGLSVGVAERKAAYGQLLTFINRRLKARRKYASIEEWIRSNDIPRASLDAMLGRDLAGISLKKALYRDPPAVSEEYVIGVSNRVAAYNAVGVLTNQLTFARATNVWQRLCRGEPWDSVAKKWTEEDDLSFIQPGGWGIVSETALDENEELKDALKNCKAGDFTPPIEADNGLCITRLDRRLDADDPEAAGHQPSVALSRIYFRLWDFHHPGTHQEIVDAATRKWEGEQFAKLMAELRAKAQIDYPYGTNLFKNASNQKESHK